MDKEILDPEHELTVIGPDEPYGDIKVAGKRAWVRCRLPLDDAPVRDFNDRQWQYARLFAAAPELVAVVKFVASSTCTCDPDVGFLCLTCEAKSALAKAGVE